MSKIAQYLNEHLVGEVSLHETVLKQFSEDGSILTIEPELIVHPRVTNDIRKVARFTWQLAEKGHPVPITARGGGSDQTGAGIGKGIIINTMAHMKNILHVALREKEPFVHVQSGANFEALNSALQANGLTIPSAPRSAAFSTIGGAIANNSYGNLSGTYGRTGEWVSKLEVVLANGDLLETGRISKRELNKKKGLQTFEGEIYREIDGIIEENQEIIEGISTGQKHAIGYGGIAQVKQRDGSFDLTPLFIGSQGTLGVISEAVLKTDYYSKSESIAVAVFEKDDQARDAADLALKLDPAELRYIDGEYFKAAREQGSRYPFFDSTSPDTVAAVLYISFNNFNDRVRAKGVSQFIKMLKKQFPSANFITSDEHEVPTLHTIRDVADSLAIPPKKHQIAPDLLSGASLPPERREDFLINLKALAKKHHIDLPATIDWISGLVYLRTELQFNQVGDRQKAFKLINEYTKLVLESNGSLPIEGRLKSHASYSQFDEDEIALYAKIRKTFDPFETLNPGVKQKSEAKTIVSALNSDYSHARFSAFGPIA